MLHRPSHGPGGKKLHPAQGRGRGCTEVPPPHQAFYGGGGDSEAERERGLERDRLMGMVASTTELDARHPLSLSVLPSPTRLLQVLLAQEASDPAGVLTAPRGPSFQGCVCFKRGPEREQSLALTESPVQGGVPGTEEDTVWVGGVPT